MTSAIPDVTFRPTQLNTAGTLRFRLVAESSPHLGFESAVIASMVVSWCDVGASTFTNISSDGGGPSSTIVELGLGWYKYTYLASRVANAGEVIFAFSDPEPSSGCVLCAVGAGAASGRLNTNVDAMSNNVVTAAAIATAAIDADAIASDAITAAKIASDAVTAAKIASDAITAAKIATGAITSSKFAAGAIDASAIASDAIAAAKIATGAFTSAKFAAGAINAAAIADGAIDAATFAAGAITAAAIATDAIDADALKTDAVTEIVNAVFANVIEDSKTFIQIVRLLTGVIAGKVADFTTGTLVFKSLNDAKTRVTYTVDKTGRLTITPGDLT